jgi:PEP-CTERM motif
MQTKFVAKAFLAGMLCWWANTASASNLFVNGDFEGGTYAQVFGSSTDILPNGWTNSPPTNSSNLNVFANGSGPSSAESGTHYIAFQSAVTDGTQDCLNQVISTVPNQKYTVSFWVAMTASSGSQYGLGPEWDSGGANDTVMGTNAFYYHPTNSPSVAYKLFSFTETASSSSTSIYFHGADATGAVLLDNVSVSNAEKSWGVDGDGNWSVGSNWIGGVAPGGIGDSASFTTIITANRTLTLDADKTVGMLTFDNPNNYLIAGTHTLTLQAAGSSAVAISISGANGNGAQTISAPITLASGLNIAQNSGGVFTIAGPLNDASGKQINVSGSGTTVVTGSINLGNATALSVGGTGKLRFLASGAATIGTGVTAAVNNSATLELAGTFSALSNGANRTNIMNNSSAPGLLVSGTHQQVGNIDGNGTTQINAGGDLTANHIIQGALVIVGTAGSAGLVTIAASDASGNPLGQSGGFAFGGSLAPSGPFGAGEIGLVGMNSGGGSELASLSPGSSDGSGNPSSVPEPSTLLLVLLAITSLIGQRIAIRHRARRTDF